MASNIKLSDLIYCRYFLRSSADVTGRNGNVQQPDGWLLGCPQAPGMSNQASMAELRDPMEPFIRAQQQLMEQRRYEEALSKQCPPDYWCTIAYFELDQQVTRSTRTHRKITEVNWEADKQNLQDRSTLCPVTSGLLFHCYNCGSALLRMGCG